MYLTPLKNGKKSFTAVVDSGSSLPQFKSLQQPLFASHVQPGDAQVEPDIKKGTQTNLQMWCIAPLSHKWSRFGCSLTETPNIEGPGVVSIETDPYAKRSLSKVFLRKRQKDYGGKKGSWTTTTTTIKGVLLPVFSRSVNLPPRIF